jgi:hypothetical protein
MKKLLLAGCLALLLAAAVVTVAAARNGNGNGAKHLNAELEGFQEVPSISTNAKGEIKLKLNGSSIQYRLEYSGFGTGTPPNNAMAAHIHFAQEGVNGGIAAFLCGGGGKPACPQSSGTVTGTITGADVRDLDVTQGLKAGDIAALIRAIKAGYTYANVHSVKFTGGEIRGQIGDDDDDDHHNGNGGRGKHDKDHDEDDD